MRLPTGQLATSHDTDTWEWLRYAACVDADPELFFPVGDSRPAAVQTRQAKEVCRGCPVQAQCLEWALTTHRTSGVWGGTDEDERRRLRRRAERSRRGQVSHPHGRHPRSAGHGVSG